MWQWLIKQALSMVIRPILDFLFDALRDYIKNKQYENRKEEREKENQNAREQLENAEGAKEREDATGNIIDNY